VVSVTDPYGRILGFLDLILILSKEKNYWNECAFKMFFANLQYP
jgi:hypothetical protein